MGSYNLKLSESSYKTRLPRLSIRLKCWSPILHVQAIWNFQLDAYRRKQGKVGVDEYYSEVLPEDKASFVEKEKAKGRKVVIDVYKRQTVTVVSEIGGNMIVNVKDSRVAIGKDMANRIMV